MKADIQKVGLVSMRRHEALIEFQELQTKQTFSSKVPFDLSD